MAENSPAVGAFDFGGGTACLDFANTVGGLRGAATTDRLGGYADLAAWSAQAGLLAEKPALALRRAAAAQPVAAGRAFARAITGREAIYAVFSAVAAKRTVPAAALDLINDALPAALG